MFVRVMKQDG